MLYREIITVCSQIYTKHQNTMCGQNVELCYVKLVVHIVITGLKSVNTYIILKTKASVGRSVIILVRSLIL